MIVSSPNPPAKLTEGEFSVIASADSNRNRAMQRKKAAVPVRGVRRPDGLPHSNRNVPIPSPEHHHLPAWVKKLHRDAEPIFSDILAALEGEHRQQIQKRIQSMVEAISAGRFSQAFRYPDLIADGGRLVNQHNQAAQAAERARRALETSKKRISDLLRQEQTRLSTEVYARLSRAAKQANTPETVLDLQQQVEAAVAGAKSLENKRRDREIDRTRERMLKSLPQHVQGRDTEEEPWQDVLRRLAGAVQSD